MKIDLGMNLVHPKKEVNFLRNRTYVLLKWNAGYSEDMLPFTNNIHQKDGGTHMLGFRSALTRVINKYATDGNLLKKNKITLTGDDTRKTHKVLSKIIKGYLPLLNT